MREMTEAELESWYGQGRWPCCGGAEYIAGPRGGMSQNITCPDCGMQLNVIDPKSHWAKSGLRIGQVLREAQDVQKRSIAVVQALHAATYGHLEHRTCTAKHPMQMDDKDKFRWHHINAIEVGTFMNLVVCKCPECHFVFTCLPRPPENG
jgi:hypothetical protein